MLKKLILAIGLLAAVELLLTPVEGPEALYSETRHATLSPIAKPGNDNKGWMLWSVEYSGDDDDLDDGYVDEYTEKRLILPSDQMERTTIGDIELTEITAFQTTPVEEESDDYVFWRNVLAGALGILICTLGVIGIGLCGTIIGLIMCPKQMQLRCRVLAKNTCRCCCHLDDEDTECTQTVRYSRMINKDGELQYELFI